MARLTLILLCCLYCAVPVCGQRSLPRCFTLSEVSCTFQRSLCGWVNYIKSDTYYWAIQGGKAVFDTSWNITSPRRSAVLISPVICGSRDCRTLSLEFDYGFSNKGGGRLYVNFLGGNATFRIVEILEDNVTTHHLQNTTLVDKGHFRISITGNIDNAEIIGSNIFLYNLCLRYTECGTTTATSDRQNTAKSMDTNNCGASTGVTSTQTSKITIDDGSDKSIPSTTITIIISACVGSGLVLVGFVVIVCFRRRNGQNEKAVEDRRITDARYSTLMENEREPAGDHEYINVEHEDMTGDTGTGDEHRRPENLYDQLNHLSGEQHVYNSIRHDPVPSRHRLGLACC